MEFGLDYYKEQYEKLLTHNRDLQAQVAKLEKLTDYAAEQTIANLYGDISVVRQLLWLIEREMGMDNPERDRVISLLVFDCEYVIDRDSED